MAVRAIPERCRSITPYLMVSDGAAAIEFYKQAFGAIELYRMTGPDGKAVMHAEIMIDDSLLFLAGGMPGMDVAWPKEKQWPSVTFYLYVEDVDGAFKRAVDAGCKVTRELANQFYGDRTGAVVDPFDQHWHLAQHVEDVTPEEMKKRMEAACQPQ